MEDAPIDGRYTWEPTRSSEVPSAYNIVHFQKGASSSSASPCITTSSSSTSRQNTIIPINNNIFNNNTIKINTNIIVPSTSKRPRALTVKDPMAAIKAKARRNLSFNDINEDDCDQQRHPALDDNDQTINNINNNAQDRVSSPTNNSKSSTITDDCSTNIEGKCQEECNSATIPRLQDKSPSTRQSSMTGEFT